MQGLEPLTFWLVTRSINHLSHHCPNHIPEQCHGWKQSAWVFQISPSIWDSKSVQPGFPNNHISKICNPGLTGHLGITVRTLWPSWLILDRLGMGLWLHNTLSYHWADPKASFAESKMWHLESICRLINHIQKRGSLMLLPSLVHLQQTADSAYLLWSWP